VQTVYQWIEGINIPSVDHLYALSRLFHVNIDDMLMGNGNTVSTSVQCKMVFRFRCGLRYGLNFEFNDNFRIMSYTF